MRLQRLSDPPPSSSYYSYFHGAYIDMVSHFVSVDGKSPQMVLNLSTDADRKLLETLRIEPISKGPYGTLSLQKECFYKTGYRSQISIRSSLSDTHLPTPMSLGVLPDRHAPVTEVSLIRIRRSASNYLIAAATYEASGRPGSVWQIEVKPGGEQLSATGYSSNFSLRNKLAELGLLQQFSLLSYEKADSLILPESVQPELQTVVVLRYGFDTILQVDTIREGKRTSSMYLKPYVDSQDALLNERCDSSLEDQLALSESTAG